MCVKFAEMERRLGEIDRARAIYGHASQFCDPRVDAVFWKKWEAFEVQHGNEDTFKEMLRIKRSVQAQFKYVSPAFNQTYREIKIANILFTAPTSTSSRRRPSPANKPPRRASTPARTLQTSIPPRSTPWPLWKDKQEPQSVSSPPLSDPREATSPKQARTRRPPTATASKTTRRSISMMTYEFLLFPVGQARSLLPFLV